MAIKKWIAISLKVVEPTPLVAEAADVLSSLKDDVVVIGAAALQIVLADPRAGSSDAAVASTRDVDLVVVTPTRDVDLVIEAGTASHVIDELEAAGLKRSEEAHERPFTWVRDDLKVQLLRPFHPFPGADAASLPSNSALSLVSKDEHRMGVAFADEPSEIRLTAVTSAALIALKHAAFGRQRHDGEPVERDYHDVALIALYRADDLEHAYNTALYEVRSRVDRALALLSAGGKETQAAARQHVAINGGSARDRANEIARAATFLARRLTP